MNIDAEILSGKSIAEIELGVVAINELLKIYNEGGKVDELEFENICLYEIDSGVVSAMRQSI